MQEPCELGLFFASSGVGSWLSARSTDVRRGLLWGLGAATVLIAASVAGLQPLLRAAIDLPLAARIVLAFVSITPLGIALGTAMPLGLQAFSARHPTGVAYAWGVNGIASVLASVLGIAIAVSAGFSVASLAALACYAYALAYVAASRSRAGPRAAAPGTPGA